MAMQRLLKHNEKSHAAAQQTTRHPICVDGRLLVRNLFDVCLRLCPPPPPPPLRTLVKQLETVQMTAAKNILGCSSTTGNTVLRTMLGVYPLETNRREKLETTINSK